MANTLTYLRIVLVLFVKHLKKCTEENNEVNIIFDINHPDKNVQIILFYFYLKQKKKTVNRRSPNLKKKVVVNLFSKYIFFFFLGK